MWCAWFLGDISTFFYLKAIKMSLAGCLGWNIWRWMIRAINTIVIILPMQAHHSSFLVSEQSKPTQIWQVHCICKAHCLQTTLNNPQEESRSQFKQHFKANWICKTETIFGGQPSPSPSLYSYSHLDLVGLLKYLLPTFLPTLKEKINSAQAEDRQKALGLHPFCQH